MIWLYKLRTAGVNDLRDVRQAYLEQNGQLNVILKGDETIKYLLILDGQIDPAALDAIDHDEDWLKAQLQEQGYETGDVYMANYLSGKVVVTPYDPNKNQRMPSPNKIINRLSHLRIFTKRTMLRFCQQILFLDNWRRALQLGTAMSAMNCLRHDRLSLNHHPHRHKYSKPYIFGKTIAHSG